jgi:serine/threonine protein kinase
VKIPTSIDKNVIKSTVYLITHINIIVNFAVTMVSKSFPDLEPPKGLFCTPPDEDHDPVFEISSKLAQNVWVVTKKGDPRKQQYLASPSSPWGVQSDGTVDYTEYDKEAYALTRLLSKQNQAYTIRQILNHENLMSIAGIMEHQLFNKSQTPDTNQKDKVQLLVTDFADAGNLSALFRHYNCDSSAFYLPESLCWHVLRSLTRAVTYLHDGKRLCHPIQLPGMFGEWVSVDTDWFPILHRRIEPRNIWFQHPRGTETYGLCKLGNFSSAAVTCHAIDTHSGFFNPPSGPHGMALAVRTGVIELDKARLALEKNPAELPEVRNPSFETFTQLTYSSLIGFTP